MTGPTPVHGWLVMTAINSKDGAADSETYRIEAVDDSTGPDGPLQRFSVKAADGFGDTRSYVVTLHELGQVLPEVRPYRELIQRLIAADVGCPGPGCKVTMLGHLLDGCTPEQIAMVKALDPDHREES